MNLEPFVLLFICLMVYLSWVELKKLYKEMERLEQRGRKK